MLNFLDILVEFLELPKMHNLVKNIFIKYRKLPVKNLEFKILIYMAAPGIPAQQPLQGYIIPEIYSRN
jgi:hypothetical protein